MRVQYTLPGLQPSVPNTAGTASARAATGARATFREHIRRLGASLPTSWRSLLRLDRAPRNAGYIGPPSRPATLEIRDMAAERVRWRSMLDRHAKEFTEKPPPGDAAQGIERMLALMMRMQELEDGVVSRHLSDARG
ncbi:MAG: hypothetical protein ACKV22_22010 [Bryobacteraceae bacterium]